MSNDYESDLPNHAEYTVVQRAEGKFLWRRILLIMGYTFFAVLYFVIALLTKLIPIVAVLPVFMWVIAHYTWRYVCPEHMVAVEAGVLTVTDILKDKKKIERLQVTLREASGLARYDHGVNGTDKSRGYRVYDYRGTARSETAYCLCFRDKQGRPSILYFETTPKLLRSVSRYMGADFHNVVHDKEVEVKDSL